MHQYNDGTPFVRIIIDTVSYFPRYGQKNQYLPITMDCFTKRPEAYALPFQETSTVAEPLVTIFCYSDHCGRYRVTKDRNFESCLMQEIPNAWE
jgi:molybdenum cofactor biosynthesis enzyme MoaA